MKTLNLLKIKNSDVVSFDIFDTLIERKVSTPTEIFDLVAKAVFDEEEAKGYKQIRIDAEKSVRARGDSTEVTLHDICQALPYSEEIQKKLEEEEIKQELDNCYRKEETRYLWDAAIKGGKKILLISDMYLPHEVVEGMVNRCGITEYHKLYVSNEYNVDKISGKLFEVAYKDAGADLSRGVHMGDSLKADFLGAKKAGLKTIFISRKDRLKRIVERWKK